MTTSEDSNSVPLREFIERVLTERDNALGLARQNLAIQIEHLNKLREDVLTKTEYNRAHEALLVKIDEGIGRRLTTCEMFQSKMVGIGIVSVIVAGVLGGLVGHILK